MLAMNTLAFGGNDNQGLLVVSAPGSDYTVELTAAGAYPGQPIPLTNNTAMLVYTTAVDYGYEAVILTVDGSCGITGGSHTVFETSGYGGADYTGRGVALSENKAVFLYSPGNAQGLYARVLSVSGTDITAGARYSFTLNDSTYSQAICALDSTHVLVAYRATDGDVSVKVLTESGGTLSADGNTGEQAVPPFNDQKMKLARLSSTKAVLADDTSHAVVITITEDTTVAVGTVLTYNGGALFEGGRDFSLIALDSTRVMVVYRDVDSVTRGIILTESGGALTAGSEYVLFTADTSPDNIDATPLTSSRVLISGYDSSGNTRYFKIVGISGSVITTTAAEATLTGISSDQSYVSALNQNAAIAVHLLNTGSLVARGIKCI